MPSKKDQKTRSTISQEVISAFELEDMQIDESTRIKFARFDRSNIIPEQALSELYDELNQKYNTKTKER